MMLLLLGEKAGMREVVKHLSMPPVSPKSDSSRWNQMKAEGAANTGEL
jgi:hypothetical protein